MAGVFGYSQLKRNVKNERRGNGAGRVYGLLKVNAVKAVVGGQVKDSGHKRGTVAGSNCRREITGTGPSTDGEASHCAVRMSLLDELRDIGGVGGVKTEDFGIWGGEAINVYGRLAQ